MVVALLLPAASACHSGPTTLSGAAEKGPFVLGSTITVATTDPVGHPSGQTYMTQTVNDQGGFSVDLSYEGLVSLQGDGFYYNEVTGALSGAPGTLRAFHEISGGDDNAYINLITHLTHDRIAALLADGMSFATAQQQAEHELREAMQLGGAPVDVAGDQMTLLGGDNDPDAYLFAASAVVVNAGITAAGTGPVDATLQQLANTIAADLAADGTLPADVTASLIAAQHALDTQGVKAMFGARLAAIGSSATVPDLDRFIDNDGDGFVNALDNCPHAYNPDQAETHGFDRGDACSPATIAVAAGDQQTGGKATTLQPFTATVTDPSGQPVAGWTVVFSVTAGHGTLSAATAVTDAFGNASTVLTLGTVIEHDVVTASTGYPTVPPAEFSADTVVDLWPAAHVGSDALFWDSPVAADFNGDGLPDVAVAAPFADTVAVMTNQTPMGATSATMAPATVLTATGTLAVADLNLDGKPDLVVLGCTVGPGAKLAATAFINTTPTGATMPSFAAGVLFSGSDCVSGNPSVAIGDLNGDGRPDLVVYQSEFGVSPKSTSEISALVNTTVSGAGAPTFASPVTLATAQGAGVALGDIDRNGTLDVIIADNGSSGALSLLSNHTTSGSSTLSFAPPVAIPLQTTLNTVSTIAMGDVNGDGIPDLVVPDVLCRTECNIAILINATPVAGLPSLIETPVAPQTNQTSDGALATLSFADVDGDGTPDLVFDDGTLETLYNATPPGSNTPSFTVQRKIYSTVNQYGLGSFALADLNGDSLVDLVGSYESALGVSIQR